MIKEDIVYFTEHAKKQMKKRRIKKEYVLLTLKSPDHFEKSSHSNETIAIKYFDSKRVRVIYISEPNEIRIITVTH